MGVKNENGLIGLNSIIKKMDNYVESRVVGLAEDLRSSLAAATPIEDPPTNTIVAREHWQISVDAYTGVQDAAGGIEARLRFGGGNRFLSAPGKAKPLAGFNIRTSKSLSVFNDVPYAARLNRGWSPQADPGYVERVIDEVTARWGML